MLVFCLFLRRSYNLNQSLILGASVMFCVPVCQPLKDKRMMMIKKTNAAQQREGSRGVGESGELLPLLPTAMGLRKERNRGVC